MCRTAVSLRWAEEAGRVPALGSSQSKGPKRQGTWQSPRCSFCIGEGRALREGEVHLPLLISLVEVICRGWLGPLGQQIEELYAIKNRAEEIKVLVI